MRISHHEKILSVPQTHVVFFWYCRLRKGSSTRVMVAGNYESLDVFWNFVKQLGSFCHLLINIGQDQLFILVWKYSNTVYYIATYQQKSNLSCHWIWT